MENEESSILIIKPSHLTLLPLAEVYQTSLTTTLEADNDIVFLCRVLIQDENDFGIILPASVKENKNIEFILPEQLCIFNPNKTYIIKAEIVLEDQLLTPFLNQCRIDLEGLLEPENDSGDDRDEEKSEAPNEPLKDDLGDVLDIIAPMPITEQKRTKLEEIASVLDQEVAKQILFKVPQKQEALTPRKVLEPPTLELTPEKLALKQKMKSMLKGMIG